MSTDIGTAGDIVVGGDEIARVLGLRNKRQVFHLASKGQLPGAFKLGGSVAVSVAAYQAGIAAKITNAQKEKLAA